MIRKYIGDLFLTTRFYLSLGVCIVLFILSYFINSIIILPKIILSVWTVLILVDYLFLFALNKRPTARRLMADRLSNGDDNKIELQVINNAGYSVSIELIDELPVQF